MRVRIKICGLTRPEDVAAAVEAGADALGFIFAEGSPRRVSCDRAAELIRGAPPFVSRVGVFVNECLERVQEVAQSCGLDTVQLHGDETPEYCERLAGITRIRGFRLRGRGQLEEMGRYRSVVEGWLIDSYVAGQAGGTGRVADWSLAREVVELGARPVILAGGLDATNVAEAIRRVKPFAVDVSSGVEVVPGWKDPGRISSLCEAVRRVELI